MAHKIYQNNLQYPKNGKKNRFFVIVIKDKDDDGWWVFVVNDKITGFLCH